MLSVLFGGLDCRPVSATAYVVDSRQAEKREQLRVESAQLVDLLQLMSLQADLLAAAIRTASTL